jgi:hypothetical protein
MKKYLKQGRFCENCRTFLIKEDLIDVLNEIADSDSLEQESEQVAISREENGIEQNWI